MTMKGWNYSKLHACVWCVPARPRGTVYASVVLVVLPGSICLPRRERIELLNVVCGMRVPLWGGGEGIGSWGGTRERLAFKRSGTHCRQGTIAFGFATNLVYRYTLREQCHNPAGVRGI
jgi:hypothetical protein